jgi:hypothetical protein
MLSPTKGKLERIVEAVRRGLTGEDAVAFVRRSGFAVTTVGIARHLKKLGGRGQIMGLIEEGKSNIEILEVCLRDKDFSELVPETPEQVELFDMENYDTSASTYPGRETPIYATAKLSIRLPSDVYEALRLAARGEGKSQNQLIVEILTAWLSQMPGPSDDGNGLG